MGWGRSRQDPDWKGNFQAGMPAVKYYPVKDNSVAFLFIF